MADDIVRFYISTTEQQHHIKLCFLFNCSTCYMFCVLCNKCIVRRQTDTWTTFTTEYAYSVSVLYHVYAVCSRLHIYIYIAGHSYYPKELSPLMPANFDERLNLYNAHVWTTKPHLIKYCV